MHSLYHLFTFQKLDDAVYERILLELHNMQDFYPELFKNIRLNYRELGVIP